jgi:hypothetical protein
VTERERHAITKSSKPAGDFVAQTESETASDPTASIALTPRAASDGLYWATTTTGIGDLLGSERPSWATSTIGISGLLGSERPSWATPAIGISDLLGSERLSWATSTIGISGLLGSERTSWATPATGISGTLGSERLSWVTPAVGISGLLGSERTSWATPATGISGTLGSERLSWVTPAVGISGLLGSERTSWATPTIGISGLLGSERTSWATPAVGISGLLGSERPSWAMPAIGISGLLGSERLSWATPAVGISDLVGSERLSWATPAVGISGLLGSERTSWATPATGISGRLGSERLSWATSERPTLDQRLLGFNHLTRLSDLVHFARPYSRRVGELLTSELGGGAAANVPEAPLLRDAAALAAGLSPDLIAFPPASYGEVVLAAGFKFHLPRVPIPTAIEAVDPGAVFDPMHGAVLLQVEQRLRQLIEDRLGKLAGGKWIRQRVSEAVRKRWTERQAEERDVGRPVYPLVQYADFMDLADVIRQGNNWREVFEPIFRNSDDFVMSLRRLHPIRRAIAHGRPLGRADVLTLVSEATRILCALGLTFLS